MSQDNQWTSANSDVNQNLLDEQAPRKRFKLRRCAIVLSFACFCPFICLAMGFDFSSLGSLPSGDVSPGEFTEMAHEALCGSLTHTLLEWTAVCAAAIVCILCLVQYRLTFESSLLVIGVALVCAGAMDAFHTLAADRLIPATADNRELIPFTWALCRLFNGCILLFGVSLFAFSKVRQNQTEHKINFVAGVGVFMILVSFVTVYVCATSDSLPKTMFPESVIKRPYDVLPLVPYLLCGFVVFPAYLKTHKSVFAYSLLLSLIPQVATQCYMAFGSDRLFDSSFNIAHALKVVGYLVPSVGLLAGYMQAFRDQRATHDELRRQTDIFETQRDTLVVQSAELEEQAITLEIQKDQLERAYEKVEATSRDVERASAYKSEFLANMSHEIRTPMTAILGFADVLLDNVTDKENRSAVTTIKRNGDYLLCIINDILDLSKIEAGKLVIEELAFSPCRLISEVASLVRVRAAAKNLQLDVTYDGSMPETINSDPTRLRQILINLLGNAIKFTEVGEINVTVRTESTDHCLQLVISVSDTGLGMSEKQLANVFQPFEQGDSSMSRRFGGTGLGLAISKRLTELLGGTIQVESELGQGSTFAISLPAINRPTSQFNRGPNASGEKPVEFASANDLPAETDAQSCLDCRVLLADDTPDIQRLVSLILKKAGAEVVCADNGLIAYELAMEAVELGSPFDVVLMDMQMPIMDGYEATTNLRAAGYTGPIVALTAHAMPADRQKCIDFGCTDYAIKPIDKKKLLGLVSSLATSK